MDISVQNKVTKRSKPRQPEFEELYFAVRAHEKRIYTDAQLQTLPDFYIHSYEWDMRKHSSGRLLAYLAKKRRFLRILEVGCGNGWLSAKMAGLPKTHVTGLDINRVEINEPTGCLKSPTRSLCTIVLMKTPLIKRNSTSSFLPHRCNIFHRWWLFCSKPNGF
ncbi:methyltransferase [Mucilaginibacter sp. S1162]|uniref:Methyltransferase n=1 Tax=Mucilaginibacter humi TaxID=2732510 RepID=A0ABX1W401_9SPHI|nr:methyltransferase [Mucilaginibacter humi]